MKSATAGAGGVVTAAYRVTRRTTFTAEFAGDHRTAPAAASKIVNVRTGLSTRVIGAYGKQGSYALFRRTVNPSLRGTVAPGHAGKQLCFTAQAYVSRVWRTTDSRCFTMDAASGVTATLTGTGRSTTVPYRLRAEFRGDADHLAITSGWSYLKFTK